MTRPLVFNLVVSNVPGFREHRYFNGSKVDSYFPMSLLFHGQALNITLCSRDKYLDFGLIGLGFDGVDLIGEGVTP